MPEALLILSVGRPVAYSAGVTAISMIVGIIHKHREITITFIANPVLHLSCGYRDDLNKAFPLPRLRDPAARYRGLVKPAYSRNRDKYSRLLKPLY